MGADNDQMEENSLGFKFLYNIESQYIDSIINLYKGEKVILCMTYLFNIKDMYYYNFSDKSFLSVRNSDIT